MAHDADAMEATVDGSAAMPLAPDTGPSVLQHHKHATRDGLYVDPLLTKGSAARLQRDAAFNGVIDGAVFAQVLYVEAGPKGREAILAVTEKNNLYALDAATGVVLWMQNLAPAMTDPATTIGCGNIAPLGVTSTPIVDLPARRVYVAGVTAAAGGVPPMLQKVFAVSLDDGRPIAGWPVDVDAKVPGFDSKVQNQRGALALLNGTLYVPYGGFNGDCGMYHGHVVGISTADPSVVKDYALKAEAAGIWGPSGIASDGTNLFATTGNARPGTDLWQGQEAVLRFQPGPTFSDAATDFFTPSNWSYLDAQDLDLGGAGPIVLDLPGATPSQLVVALGKQGTVHLVDRANLGGFGKGDGGTGEGVASLVVADGEIKNAGASYATAKGTYVVFNADAAGVGCPKARGGNLVALRLGIASPPTIEVAWCNTPPGAGAPMATTTDGKTDPLVWVTGSQRLYAFDGDTGDVVFKGGGAPEAMSNVNHWISPIAVKGRIVVAGDDAVYAFSVK